MMSTFGDNPTLSTLGSGGRLKISRGSIHAHVRGTVTYLGFGGTGSLGFPWGRTEAVAERPELLANHWPQLLRWTERQAPNVNIGGCALQEGALLPRGPDLHDLPLFSHSPGSSLLHGAASPFPSDFPGKALAVADPRLLIDPIVLVPIVVVPTSANSRDGGPKHDLVRSSGVSLCHDACGALEPWKARQPYLRPTTTSQQGAIRACTARSLSRSGAEDF